MDFPLADIETRLKAHLAPQRRALSSRYPALKRPIVGTRCLLRSFRNRLERPLRLRRSPAILPCVVARHQSVLRRQLGDSDPRLQEQKIVNLRAALAHLDGLVIPPGATFSFWDAIGEPTPQRGFVNGMLLAGGRVTEGPGGGLCQLANFLFWILQHAPVETVERHHHSVDAFPDSGRTLPFGSGATVLYNFIDLKLRNVGPTPLQLKLWLTDRHLKGQVRSTVPSTEKFRLAERHHCFVKHGGRYFRYNQIWRQKLVCGQLAGEELLVTNFAPVAYEIDEKNLDAAPISC
jgi:vancomycin resistance protein VanW